MLGSQSRDILGENMVVEIIGNDSSVVLRKAFILFLGKTELLYKFKYKAIPEPCFLHVSFIFCTETSSLCFLFI